MEMGSTQRCNLQSSITVTIGNITYIVEHIYDGDRTLLEAMSDFLEQKVRSFED